MGGLVWNWIGVRERKGYIVLAGEDGRLGDAADGHRPAVRASLLAISPDCAQQPFEDGPSGGKSDNGEPFVRRRHARSLSLS